MYWWGMAGVSSTNCVRMEEVCEEEGECGSGIHNYVHMCSNLMSADKYCSRKEAFIRFTIYMHMHYYLNFWG